MNKRGTQQTPPALVALEPRYRQELTVGRDLKEREGRQSAAGARSRLGVPYVWTWPTRLG